ncbi:MAG TPA: zinc-ribbon domain-containing protein [Chloroflexia bacterium]|nr:zinc-ribbon domain-containing protein [Chloroflexia bacterium]
MASQTCPNCGWLNRATNRFCSNCGASMVPSTDGPTTEDTGQPTSNPAGSAGVSGPATPDATTQPVTYVVQRWNTPTPDSDALAEAAATAAPSSSGFIPPVPSSQGSNVPIAPPPVPPYSSTGADTTVFGMGATGSSVPSTTQPDSARNSGGAYVPYSTEAAQQLQAGTPKRSWLIPTIAVGALALLVLVGISGFLILNGAKQPGSSSSGLIAPGTTSPSNTGSALKTGCTGLASQTGNSDDNTALKATVCQSNDEQIKAWRSLDTEVLKNTRTGQALQENIQAVQELQSKKMYALPANVSIDFGKVTVSGDTATVETTEVWSVTFFNSSDGKALQTQGPDKLQELYHFVKQNGKWLIQSVDITATDAPTPTLPPGSNNA